MRTLLWAVGLVAVIGVAGGAQVQGQEPRRIREGGREELAERLLERIQDLNLTDEQEERLSGIRKEHRPKIEENAKELATLLREECEKVKAVLTVEQLDKCQEMNSERKECRAESLAERVAHVECLELTGAEIANLTEIRNQFRPKVAKTLEVLRGLLTEEQKLARDQALEAGKKRKEVIATVKLTDDQQDKITAVGRQLRSLVREELTDIHDVLSPEQQDKTADFRDERRERVRDRLAHAISNCKELNLTAEQKQKISAIRQEYRPKVHEAGNKLRAAVREEIQDVVGVLKA